MVQHAAILTNGWPIESRISNGAVFSDLERPLPQFQGHAILWRGIFQTRYDIQAQCHWNTNRDLHTPYATVSFRMTASDREWLSKILNNTKCCAVFLRQLSFLFNQWLASYDNTWYNVDISNMRQNWQVTSQLHDIKREKSNVYWWKCHPHEYFASRTVCLPITQEGCGNFKFGYAVSNLTFQCSHASQSSGMKYDATADKCTIFILCRNHVFNKRYPLGNCTNKWS